MVIADTGYWLALSDSTDPFFKRAVAISEELDEALITTWPVLTETCYLLLARRGIQAMHRFLTHALSGGCTIFEVTEEHYERLQSLIKKYQDLPMDLADASLVVLAEHLGHGRILSTDNRDFKSFRWKQRKPFENLLVL